MIAHVGVVPLEEIVPSLLGAGGALALARGWIILRLRDRREPDPSVAGLAGDLGQGATR